MQGSSMKNFSEMSDEELQQATSLLEGEQQKRAERIRQQRMRAARANLANLKGMDILSRIQHSRTSCSDENPCNGYDDSVGYARCTKCHLMEILETNDDTFEVSLGVTITKIQ